MEVVILGAGAHGHDLYHIASAAGHYVSDFYDDNLEEWEPFRRLVVLGSNVGYLIGINSPDKREQCSETS